MATITPKIKKLIEENALALATVDGLGNPHCIVVGYPKVVSKNQIVISNIYMVDTVKNIQKNNNVVLTVWNREWKNDEICVGYELKGKAEMVSSGKWKKFADSLDENKGYKLKGAILVAVNKIKKLV